MKAQVCLNLTIMGANCKILKLGGFMYGFKGVNVRFER